MSNAIQEVFKKFGNSYKKTNTMSTEQRKVFESIINCKTRSMGGHIYKCEECGEKVYSYNSCKNRHCPNCQEFKKEQWIMKHEEEILQVPYYHIVFTLPGELHKIFYHNKRKCYNIILKSAAEVVLELTRDKKYLGARPGIVEMLHTWTQVAAYHPHVHMIVTGGGLTDDGIWKRAKEDFFLPIKVIEAKFRGKVLAKLKEEKLEFYKEIEYLKDKGELNKYLSGLYEKPWICYCKPPFQDVKSVYKYLAKYVYKVCMANERIERIFEKSVTFKYKDSDDRSISKKMNLKGEEFIRRFLLHVLPKNFMKIRYYGLFSGRGKKERIKRLKIITKTKNNESKLLDKLELLNKINGFDVRICQKCSGNLILIKTIDRIRGPDKRNISGEKAYA